MKIGLIARADRTGLAVQTWEFYKNMNPYKTLVINPTWIGHGQSVDPTMYDDYIVMDSKPYPETAMVVDGIVDHFLDELDVVFTCETPYNYWIYERARQRGVKTFCQFNFEFLDGPGFHLPGPDVYVGASMWRWDDVPYANKVYLPVPVNREVLPYQRKEQLSAILHTAGIPAIHDRNGTELLVRAMTLLPPEVDVQLHLRAHQPLPYCRSLPKIVTSYNVVDRYYDLYEGEEDVYIMPRKYGGLCLPLNEASSCGMPVIMTDVSPQNEFLPPEALLSAREVTEFMAKTMIKVYQTTAEEIADKIIELYHNPELVQMLSEASNAYADSISWENMRPVYLKTFEQYL